MAGQNIKGLTVEIDGDVTGLEDALRKVGKASNDINKELKEVEQGLKFDPGNTTLIAQKQELLTKKIGETKKGLDALKQAQGEVERMYGAGEIDDGQYRKFQRELTTTESKLKTFEAQLKDVDGAQDKVNASAGKATKSIGSMGKGLAIAGAGGVAALTSLTTDAVQAADRFQTLSDKTGISVGRLQELDFAAKQLGVDVETLAKADAKLTKGMDSARAGTGATADAFKALGVAVTNSDGSLRDSDEVMQDVFAALGEIENQTERDAVSAKIFGKSFQDLNPLIEAGADGLSELTKQARESGTVMSDETVAGLDQFGDSMNALKVAVVSTIGSAFSKLMPVLQPILDIFMKAPGPIKVIVGVIAALGVGLVALMPILIAFTAVEWAALAPILPIVAALAALIAIIVLVIKYHEEIAAAFIKAWGAIKTAFTAAWDAIKGAFTAAWNAIKAGFSAAWDWLSGIPGRIKGLFSKALDWLVDAGKSILTGLWNGIKWVWDNLIVGWWKLGPKILSLLSGAGSWLVGIGRDILNGLWKGLQEVWARIWSWLKEKIDSIGGFFKKILGIGSPSKVMADIGADTMLGFEVGLKEGWRDVMSAMTTAGVAIAGSSSSSTTSTSNVYNITIDGSRMPSADFNGLISSIQAAQRMGA